MTAMLLDLVTAAALTKVIIAAAAGASIGALHFRVLWWSLSAGSGALRFVGLATLRWSLTIALFVALALIGTSALFAGTLGLLTVRHVVLRQIGRRI